MKYKYKGREKKYLEEYYQKHKERIKERVKEYYQKHKKYYRECMKEYNQKCLSRSRNIVDQMKKLGCYFCGELDPDILEFAHIDLREFIIGAGGLHGVSQIIREIEKCEIMCCNCHRKFDLGKLQLREVKK